MLKAILHILTPYPGGISPQHTYPERLRGRGSGWPTAASASSFLVRRDAGGASEAVHEFFASSPCCTTFRESEPAAGGAGVTIAELG